MTNASARDSLSNHEDVRAALNGTPSRLHMTGIGGVGMAGLALLLKERGWQVSGCDAFSGPLIPWLKDKGIDCSIQHSPEHLDNVPAFIVRSPAVQRDEPELIRARDSNIPIIDRGMLLPALMQPYRLIAVSGTHGKTSTASMIAWILTSAGEKTSYCIGGVCPCLKAVAHVEHDGFMVIEADESDGTLQYYKPEIAVVTSMDIDHVDYYESADQHLDVYKQFADDAGAIIYNSGDPEARELFGDQSSAISFGVENYASVSASDISMNHEGCRFELHVDGKQIGTVQLSVNGRHNVANALSAIAAAKAVGISYDSIFAALATFRLPLRRFEEVANGKGISVISDYAHHPVEISALMEQARLIGTKRIVALFQPHRFSRTKAFLHEFVDALESIDCVILLPVYAASEPFIPGGTTDELYQEFQNRGHIQASLAKSVEDGWNKLQKIWQEGDLVLLIGAGDLDVIGSWSADKLNG